MQRYPLSFTIIAASALTLLLVPLFVHAQNEDLLGTKPSGVYCPALTQTIKSGDSDTGASSQVKELQHFLADYFDQMPTNLMTGYFGPTTLGFVKKFQCKVMGICSGVETSTGYGLVGSGTRGAIASACEVKPAAGTNGNTYTINGSSSFFLWSLSGTGKDAPGTQLVVHCPPIQYVNGLTGVYGSNPYSQFSNICLSGAHAGAIKMNKGGDVAITVIPAVNAVLPGSTNNGITSNQITGGNFRVTNGTLGASCLYNGGIISEGQSITAYQTYLVPEGGSCSSIAQTRTCTNGVLSGTHLYSSCVADISAAQKTLAAQNKAGATIAAGANFAQLQGAGPNYSVVCPPVDPAVLAQQTASIGYGTNPYHRVNSVCYSAAHAGVINPLVGGMVKIRKIANVLHYAGAANNGFFTVPLTVASGLEAYLIEGGALVQNAIVQPTIAGVTVHPSKTYELQGRQIDIKGSCSPTSGPLKITIFGVDYMARCTDAGTYTYTFTFTGTRLFMLNADITAQLWYVPAAKPASTPYLFDDLHVCAELNCNMGENSGSDPQDYMSFDNGGGGSNGGGEGGGGGSGGGDGGSGSGSGGGEGSSAGGDSGAGSAGPGPI